MNFAISWLFDKLGYMPKIDMQVGKVNLDIKPPEFQMWPFREETPKKPAAKTVAKKKPAVKKTTRAKK